MHTSTIIVRGGTDSWSSNAGTSGSADAATATTDMAAASTYKSAAASTATVTSSPCGAERHRCDGDEQGD
jgi:hypothetical protein